MTIYLVKSNLKIDGDSFQGGSFIEGDSGRFSQLISDKVLEEVTGAETMEEAKAIVAKRDAEVKAEEEVAEEQKPQNTWGPTPKEEETPDETADITPEEKEKTDAPKEEVKKDKKVKADEKVTTTPADSANKPAETTPPADEDGANL